MPKKCSVKCTRNYTEFDTSWISKSWSFKKLGNIILTKWILFFQVEGRDLIECNSIAYHIKDNNQLCNVNTYSFIVEHLILKLKVSLPWKTQFLRMKVCVFVCVSVRVRVRVWVSMHACVISFFSCSFSSSFSSSSFHS